MYDIKKGYLLYLTQVSQVIDKNEVFFVKNIVF